MYDTLARRSCWVTVECFDDTRKEMRTPETIAADVLAIIESLLTVKIASHAGHAGKDRS